MRLTAYVLSDGSIQGFVVQPEAEMEVGLLAEPGIEVCEITDHGLGESVDFEQLHKLRQEYNVDITPATGRLVPREDGSSAD